MIKVYRIVTVLLLLVTSYLLLVTPIYAQACTNPNDWQCIIGGIKDPTGVPGSTGDEKLSNFISRIIELIFIAAAVVFVFMIIMGAFQWISSGGEKEGIAKARTRITHAIIGFILLALAFVIINVISNITNIGILSNNRFTSPRNPNQPQNPGFNNPVVPPGQNNQPPFTNPFVPNDQNPQGFNDPQFPGGGGDSGNQAPCCPPASRKQNNQCIDTGTNLAVPALNPGAC